jgi:hypothetical protein
VSVSKIASTTSTASSPDFSRLPEKKGGIDNIDSLKPDFSRLPEE